MDYNTDRFTVTLVMNLTTRVTPEMNLSSPKPTCGPVHTFTPNVLLLIFYSIFFILGVFGNGMLVLLFLMKKKLRTINNAFITNLAFSDLLFVILYAPIKFYEEFYALRPFGLKFCYISVMMNYTSQEVSTMSMTALSYLRYRAVMRPLQIRQDDRNRLKWFIPVSCGVSWCVAAAAALFPALDCTDVSYRCWFLDRHYVNSYNNPEHHLIFHIMRFVFFYLLPLTIIAIFYSKMAIKLCRAPSVIRRNDSLSATRATKSRKKLGGVVLVIVVIFFLSWLPNYLAWFIGLSSGFVEKLNHLRSVCMFLPASLNPILLFVTSSGYRQPLLGFCPGSRFVHRLRSSPLTASLASIRLSRLSRISKRSSSELPSPS